MIENNENINENNNNTKTLISEYLTQQEAILINMLDFYKDEMVLSRALKIINGKSKISLRIIDWFVTNYAKQYFTRYELMDASGNIEVFKVHNKYQCFLDSYKKERFDPFCRWERVFFPYQDNSYIETTVGQLKFFKWAIEKKIIDFVEEHYEEIENDMNTRNSSSKKQKTRICKNGEESENSKTKKRKKREELSISATKCMKKETVDVVLSFK